MSNEPVPSIRMSPADSIALLKALDSSQIISNYVSFCQKNEGGYYSEVTVQYYKYFDSLWLVDNIWKHYTDPNDFALDFTIAHFPEYTKFITSNDVVLVYLGVELSYNYELNEIYFKVGYSHDLKRIKIFDWKKKMPDYPK